MTIHEVIQIASMCAKREDSTCSIKGCPLYSRADCKRHLLGCAVMYLSMYRAGMPLGDSTRPEVRAPLNPNPDLFGGILGHYKKPFVTIEINISEDET